MRASPDSTVVMIDEMANVMKAVDHVISVATKGFNASAAYFVYTAAEKPVKSYDEFLRLSIALPGVRRLIRLIHSTTSSNRGCNDKEAGSI